jgi:hypothetical protein
MINKIKPAISQKEFEDSDVEFRQAVLGPSYDRLGGAGQGIRAVIEVMLLARTLNDRGGGATLAGRRISLGSSSRRASIVR